MLTRAYDAIMAALQTPMITYHNVDFNNTTIDDSVLNCKDCSGDVRTIFPNAHFNGSRLQGSGISGFYIPFAYWQPSNEYSNVFPDEEESTPDYEDYSVSIGNPPGWTVSSQYPSFSKSYDTDTKEFVCSITMLWQNTSGVAKTVYGVKVRCQYYYRSNYNTSSPSTISFLICREHFAAPVVVEDQGIISLTFTWRVGRAGLVSATAAAAE